jgi:hypothetical protein
VIASAMDDALGGRGLITQLPIKPQTVKAILERSTSEVRQATPRPSK